MTIKLATTALQAGNLVSGNSKNTEQPSTKKTTEKASPRGQIALVADSSRLESAAQKIAGNGLQQNESAAAEKKSKMMGGKATSSAGSMGVHPSMLLAKLPPVELEWPVFTPITKVCEDLAKLAKKTGRVHILTSHDDQRRALAVARPGDSAADVYDSQAATWALFGAGFQAAGEVMPLSKRGEELKQILSEFNARQSGARSGPRDLLRAL